MVNGVLVAWEFKTNGATDAEKCHLVTDKNQVIISANQQNDISALLTDLPSLREKYVIQLVESKETPEMVQFSLQPKKKWHSSRGLFPMV